MDIDHINEQINNVFASVGVLPDGPGEEAFWNAVEEVSNIDLAAYSELLALAEQWQQAREESRSSHGPIH